MSDLTEWRELRKLTSNRLRLWVPSSFIIEFLEILCKVSHFLSASAAAASQRCWQPPPCGMRNLAVATVIAHPMLLCWSKVLRTFFRYIAQSLLSRWKTGLSLHHRPFPRFPKFRTRRSAECGSQGLWSGDLEGSYKDITRVCGMHVDWRAHRHSSSL